MQSQRSLFGFPLRVDPSFALVAIFGLSLGSVVLIASWVAVVFVTTLVHELGHAFAFRAYGRQARVTLWAFGGLTQGEGEPLSPAQHRIVSVAGPLASMLLLGVPALYLVHAAHLTSTAGAVARMLEYVAVGWSVVNLLPIIPLDGGHIAASVFEQAWGVRGAVAARVLSIVVAAAGIAAGIAYGFPFAAVFAGMFILQNLREIGTLHDAGIVAGAQEGHARLDEGRLDEARRVAADVRRRSRSPHGKAAAAELVAWIELASGRRGAAAEALHDLPHEMRPSRGLVAAILLVDGEREAALAAAADAAETEEPPNVQLALALDSAGMLDEVVRIILQRPAGVQGATRLAALLRSRERAALAARIDHLLMEHQRFG